MANDKKYVSVLNYPKVGGGTEDLYIKDAEAREALGDLIEEVSNGFHYRGISTTEITDGATTGPWTIDGVAYVPDNVTPSSGQVALQAGDIAAYGNEDYIWSTTSHKWRKFGTTGRLGALAYKDSASGSYTPAGTISKTTSKLVQTTVTGVSGSTSVTGVSGSTSVTGVTGSTSASSVSATSKKLATTSLKGVAGTATVHDTPSLTSGTLPSLGNPTTGNFNTDAVKITSYDETNEKLTFGAAATSSAVTAQGTFSAGSFPTIVAGTEKTFATANQTATTVATGSLVDTSTSSNVGDTLVEAVSISSVTVPIADAEATTVPVAASSATTVPVAASTATTVATGALDADGTGASVVTDASFSGTAATITVS